MAYETLQAASKLRLANWDINLSVLQDQKPLLSQNHFSYGPNKGKKFRGGRRGNHFKGYDNLGKERKWDFSRKVF